MRLIARAALLLASAVLALALLEGGLRLALLGSLANPQPASGLTHAHPTRGWALTPNATGVRSDIDYRVEVRISSQGLRDVEHSIAADPNVFRVVVLGDSFMEAYQVELRESLPRRLEDELAPERVEVINLGVGGYGTLQESLALDEQGLRFDPDLVVLAFYAGNDLRNNSELLETRLWQDGNIKSFGRPYARLRGKDLLQKPPDFATAQAWIEAMRQRDHDLRLHDRLLAPALVSALLQRLAHRIGAVGHAYDPNLVLGAYATRFDPDATAPPLSADEYRAAWEEAWQITQALILRTRATAERHGARFVLLSVPSKFQVDPRYRERVTSEFPRMRFDPELPSRRLRGFADEQGIELLDLQGALVRQSGAGHPPLYHAFRDRHWNAEGHRVAASELARFLRQRRLVPEAL